MMELLPSIDLLDGKVIRLVKGRLDRSIHYHRDPFDVAKEFESCGVDGIHIIDIGATMGVGENEDLIARLANGISIPVQVGGGIRSAEKAIRLLESGIDRVILGTLAFECLEDLKYLLARFGAERIVVALDYGMDGVMVRGWARGVGMRPEDAIDLFGGLGVKKFLATCIDRDGTMLGPDLDGLSRLVEKGYEVYASGGIRDLKDLLGLRSIGVKGAIVGRAYYEGAIDLREAVRLIRGDAGQEDHTLPGCRSRQGGEG